MEDFEEHQEPTPRDRVGSISAPFTMVKFDPSLIFPEEDVGDPKTVEVPQPSALTPCSA